MRLITRPIPQNILVAQLRADLRSDVRQVVYILDAESAPAGEFCHFIEQRGAIEFLRSAAAISERLKYADGLQLSIRLPHQPLDIFLAVPAVVISSVRDDQQGSFAVSSGAHFAQAQIDRIEKRSAAFP